MTIPATTQGCFQSIDTTVEEIYERERNIQLKARENVADIEITLDETFKQFAQDPWAHETPSLQAIRDQLSQQRHHKIVIVGAGHGGLLFVVRLIQAGKFHADDILLIDTAAGFGGTWYWNRYPGLMCDSESYIYMPLLEETGYMPRNKYAFGAEIREHTERIAQRWGLIQRAMFRTTVKNMDWDEQQKVWMVSGFHLGTDQEQTPFHVSADFTILATGAFASPRVPDFPNILDYEGKLFHTARWDYDYTGGTPTSPEMSKLVDKKVAIIGAGASAVQIVPLLAKYSGELIVCNRTPASVDQRGNRPTDPAWWKDEISREGHGWQARRQVNFNAFTSNEKPLPDINKVADGWTEMPSFSLLTGGPQGLDPDYVTNMRAVDLVRQKDIRARVQSIVRQPEAADLLTPWYPGWCKRPCFHDDYLLAFNQPNVRLLDLRHHGISHFTPKGFVTNDTEIEVDAVILSTGYTVPVTRNSPASRADITVTGLYGMTMEDKWERGLATLHGVMTRGLPNLFFAGTSQAGACVNLTYTLDQNAIHVAYIISKAVEKCSDDSLKVIVEPTHKGEEDWTAEVISRAAGFRGIVGCTPGYLNGYGMGDPASLSVKEQAKAVRLAAWGEGIGSYVRHIETWRKEGNLDGLELTYVPLKE